MREQRRCSSNWQMARIGIARDREIESDSCRRSAMECNVVELSPDIHLRNVGSTKQARFSGSIALHS